MPFTKLAVTDAQLEHRSDNVKVRNPFSENFICRLNGQAVGIKAGATVVYPFHKAKFIADRIVDELIMRENVEADKQAKKKDKDARVPTLRGMNDQKRRLPLFTSVFIDETPAGEIDFDKPLDELDESEIEFGEEVKEPSKKKTK